MKVGVGHISMCRYRNMRWHGMGKAYYRVSHANCMQRRTAHYKSCSKLSMHTTRISKGLIFKLVA